MACIDITFHDGRRPLAEHLPALAGRGFEVEAMASPLNQVFDYGSWAAAKAPGATAAAHTVVELTRPA